MTQEQERQLSQTMLAMMQSGGDAPKSTVETPVYAWRLIRWEADVPLTEEQRQEALAIVPEAMALCGVSAACFAADGDVMTVLLALTRFPARAHRDPVLWLCAHALMEQASVALEQDGTMFIGEEFDLAATWAEHLKPMREISDWWTRVSPLDGAAAHRHRKELQTCIKRRQYAVLGGYVSRALREDQNLSVTCFAFVPLVIEAIWSQHAELTLRTLTEGLNLNEMTRSPRQALLAWLKARGVTVVLATSSKRDRAVDILTRLGVVQYFDDMVFGTEIERGKPYPDIFLKAAEKAHAAPADCLVLEDSEAGIQAAHAAGIDVICVPDMKTPAAEFQQMTAAVLKSLDDVQAWLTQPAR